MRSYIRLEESATGIGNCFSKQAAAGSEVTAHLQKRSLGSGLVPRGSQCIQNLDPDLHGVSIADPDEAILAR
jgi:hypothetical protein